MYEHKVRPHWYTLTAGETVLKLETDLNQGLAREEAAKRKKIFGLNEIVSRNREGFFQLVLRQLNSTFVLVLLVASVVSFALGDRLDGWVILAAVVANVFVGYIQEEKANRSLRELTRVIEHQAKALRDGAHRLLDARDLVPGDIVLLSRGDRVPADVRIIEAHHLMINESAFSGESKDVEKNSKTLSGKLILPDQRNMAFLGSLVTAGSARGIVVETGAETALGSISALLTPSHTPSVLQVQMNVLSKKLGLVIFFTSSVLFVLGLAFGISFLEIFTTSVAVSVSAIPEGLAVVVTVVLAFGMRTLVRLKGLVKTLPACETLGCTSVVCTDKTGTLTTGHMAVKTLGTRDHLIRDVKQSWFESLEQKPKELLTLFELGLLCNDASAELKDGNEVMTGNLTDQAILRFVRGFGFSSDEFEKSHPRIDTVPFDSENKFMATLHRRSSHNLLVLKGSPELTLELSSDIFRSDGPKPMSPSDRTHMKEVYQSLAKNGMRVLGIVYKELPKFVETLEHYPMRDFIFVGFLGLADPVREEVPDMIHQLFSSHVRVIMVTGDNRHTAASTAREIGLKADEKHVLDGEAIDRMNTTELMAALKRTDVCARIVPEHKLRIVQALQESGEVVAMTGDGVNDAPALHKADIGIALESGTDVAKEAADMVLLNNSFATIGKAIFYGRVMFANLRKIVVFLLSDNFIELFMIGVAIVLQWEAIPILASQILWKNLISDGLPALALSREGESEGILRLPPRNRTTPILEKEHKRLIMFTSALFAGIGILLFVLYWKNEVFGGVPYARSVVFAFISLGPLLNILNLRSLGATNIAKSFFENAYLLGALGVSLGLLVLAFSSSFFRTILHLTPLSLFTWIQVILLVLVCLITIRFMKGIILMVAR